VPVQTTESSAGTGDQTAEIALDTLVLVSVTLSNPNVYGSENASIKLYQGTSKQGIVAATLISGWASQSHDVHWQGRLNLRGSYLIVGTINHAASVKHRITVVTEPKQAMPQGLWDWQRLWTGARQ